MHSALALCNPPFPLRGQTPHPGQVLTLDGNSSLSQGRPSHPGQMLRLVCPGGHTSCCIYALLKALLRLLSYEKKIDVQRLGWKLSHREPAKPGSVALS